jgi:PAS domain S-box-containing protein
LRNDQGEIIGILGISMDITEQKEAEKIRIAIAAAEHQSLKHAKEASENTLKNIVNLMPGHVYWKSLDFRYLGCNQLQAESAGFSSPEEFCGKTDADMPWRARAKEIRQIDEQVIHNLEMVSAEEVARLSDGREVTFLSKKVPLKAHNGEVIGILGISFDITDQKDAERLRLENAIAEQNIKTATMLAAGIAHELRTPLAAVNLLGGQLEDLMGRLIEGYTLALHHDLIKDPLTEKNLHIAAHVSTRLLRIVRSANTFIDMMLMKVNLKKPKGHSLIRLSICSAIEEALQTYPLDESDHNLIHWDRDRNQIQDFIFLGNQTLFNHVIFNLLKNALHYIKAARNGEITIWVSRTPEGNSVHFKDTGPGIPQVVLPHIFEAFYTQTTHGTGVGLALCRAIMDEFDGTIACESVEGEYTHFILTFPNLKSKKELT